MWNREEIKDIVKMIRLDLYNHELKYSGPVIRGKLQEMEVVPLPSVSTIYRMLDEEQLTNWRNKNCPEV